jgi:hypothetical protein
MSYQKHFSNTKKAIGYPSMTISKGKSGNLYISKVAMESFFSKIQWVELFFDEKNKKIAIKPLKQPIEGCYKLRFSSAERKSTGMVSAPGFLKRNFLADAKGKKLRGSWNKKKRILEFQL